MSWIPLHIHSQYSILNSTVAIEPLVQKAKKLSLPSIALIDEGSMYGIIEFYKSCQQAGIQPIIGCELHVAPGSRFEKKKIPGTPPGFPIILLAKTKRGYQNLCKLSSFAHLEGFYYTPRIDKELLLQYSEGLICLSGSPQGLLTFLILQGKEKELLDEICWLQQCFKEEFYFELQRHTMSQENLQKDQMDKEGWLLQKYQSYIEHQELVIQTLTQLGQRLGVTYVATHAVHYLEREEWKAHEILINIQSGEPVKIWEFDSQGNPKASFLNPKRRVYPTHELYLKSPAQMNSLFADHPEALTTSLEIAHKIECELDLNTRHYPMFTPPESISKEAYLKKICLEGRKMRYTEERLLKIKEKYPDRDPLQLVQERLDYELGVIISKKMSDYILIVHDFISWAKANGIPVGPGRGSGAGSILLFVIGITDIEPLRFNLLFERFINPERPSYPDIDVDICMDKREEVIDYTIKKYGKERVAQIITFGTMKAKMAIKDVGRVLSIPLKKVNAIAKLIPEELGITLDKALMTDPDLKEIYEQDPEVKYWVDLARSLEGSIRNTGVHAAGFIISKDPLTEHLPVCLAKDSEILTTQFSMKPVESLGMLKIDFLGLKTLTAIQKTTESVLMTRGTLIDWVNLPLNDMPTFELMNEGKLNGIFQMESSGMQDLSKQLQIDKFEEIIAVVALYRPGPMEMIPSFIQRKQRREAIEMEHPLMKEILAETYGIMVYQEQVMQIASLLALYTLGEGDVFRRAMGKKDREEMIKQRDKFQRGALQNGIAAEISLKIFDKIEKFASYGFNKSHATAYAYLAYATAYLKANYPMEWMAALMTCDRHDLTKVTRWVEDAQSMHLPILPPDINESTHEFVPTSRGIRFAMTAIKGIGKGIVDLILKEKKNRGHFSSLSDFCIRMEVQKIGKKTILSLVEAGCFDFTEFSRQDLSHSLEHLYERAMQKQQEASKGWIDLFDTSSPLEETLQAIEKSAPTTEVKSSILRREKELLGFYVTGHPLDDFQKEIELLSCIPLSEIVRLEAETCFKIAFIIEEVRIKISLKNQKKFAVLKISDGTTCIEIPIWWDLFEKKSLLLREDNLLCAILTTDHKEKEMKLRCLALEELSSLDEQVREKFEQLYLQLKSQKKRASLNMPYSKNNTTTLSSKGRVFLKLDAQRLRMSHILLLKEWFRSSSGPSSIVIEFASATRSQYLLIASLWGISLSPTLRAQLQTLPSFAGLILQDSPEKKGI